MRIARIWTSAFALVALACTGKEPHDVRGSESAIGETLDAGGLASTSGYTADASAAAGGSPESPSEDSDPASPGEGVVASEVIDFNNCSSNTAEQTQRFVVIRDANALSDEYERTVWLEGPHGELPAVDFDEAAVVALYFGSGSCNNELTVTAVDDGEAIEVRAALALPNGSCVVQPLETYPFAFVVVPVRTDYRVVFGDSNFTCN